MAEPVTLTLTIGKDGSGKPTRDHAGKHPVLHKDDTLKLHTTTTDWPTGITEIKFYGSETDYENDNAFASWVSGTTEIRKGSTTLFTVSESASGGKVVDVSLKDAETLAAGEDAMYYKVMLGATPLDPEVVNKSGTGTGRNSDHWVSNSTG